MKIRTISGAVFAAIIVGFLLLRQFVNPILFNILICFFSAVGTFEVARALKPISVKIAYPSAIVFGILLVPVYTLFDCVIVKGYGYLASLCLVMLFVDIIAFACDFKADSFKTSFFSILPIIYPALLIICMAKLNGLDNGFIGLVLLFVISPFTDVMAYFVGMAYNKIKKGNAKKLCPKLSPKKTWAGAIGGTIGGVVGSILVYLIFKPNVNFFAPWLLFVIMGFVGAIINQIGDLIESAIKRKVGIKDMGKIMPGHGGVMDRIDGISFNSAFILLVLALV